MAERCRRAECGGAIEDGYCDQCGLAAAAGNGASGRATSGIGAVPAVSRVTTGTGSTPVSRAGGGTRRTRATSRRTARRGLGAGLVALPELPPVDPERAVLAEATVPERKRVCGACEAPLRREAGFCGKCGTRYSFVPTLRAGDVVAGQYEVKGPIAFGGLGWIYLGFDRLLRRYVVLKGLLNTQDSSAAAAAVAERQFLAAVKHPQIVGIYNFVEFGGEGFIVMEYVGGRTLKAIRGERGPLPSAEAMAYIHRILPAFGYLHRMGLVYCDFKPDNVMLEGDDVKLIDLGGVRRVDDPGGDIYGTVGYSAPEAGAGPTAASDLFTVGRTLAVLLTEIPGFGREHRYTLPGPAEKPLFAEQESLYRWLLKATAEAADDRFGSAEEMAEQLLGVLREVVARETGEPRPGASVDFGGDLLAVEAGAAMEPVRAEARYLPLPAPDAGDGASAAVAGAMVLPEPERRLAALRLACGASPRSREARLRLAGALTDAGTLAEAEELLRALAAEDAWDWRVLWFRARVELRRGQAAAARRLFDQVYFDLPGELAPKLAMGFAAELAGELGLAERMYGLVAAVDPGFVSAVFGLARCLRARGDCRGAVKALGRIPASSALHVRAGVTAVRVLLEDRGGPPAGSVRPPALEDVLAAGAMAEALPLDGGDRMEVSREVFRAALAGLGSGRGNTDGNTTLLGQRLAEGPLRLGLEATLRRMARQAGTEEERIGLVDEANRVRPRTVV